MGMNTIKLNAGHTQYAGQATFFFYQKSATGVTSTEIDVFVNSGFIARMSPTEHFKISGASNTIDFVPVDPNNTATFITGDVGEEYGSSQVAGSVQISNLSAQIPVADLSKYGSSAFISNVLLSLNTFTAVEFAITNSDSVPVALTSVELIARDQTVSGAIKAGMYSLQVLEGGSVTGNAISSAFNLDGVSGANGACMQFVRQTATGTVTITGGALYAIGRTYWPSDNQGKFNYNFEDSLILPPGAALIVDFTSATAGGANDRIIGNVKGHKLK